MVCYPIVYRGVRICLLDWTDAMRISTSRERRFWGKARRKRDGERERGRDGGAKDEQNGRERVGGGR